MRYNNFFFCIFLSFFLLAFSSNKFNSLLKEKKLNEAEELLLSSDLSEINRVEHYLKIAIEFFNNNNFSKAKSYLIKVILYKADEPKAHTYLGIIYYYEKNYAKSQIELQTAIKLNNREQIAYTYLGKLYFQENDYINAEKYYLTGLAIDEDNPQHLFEITKFYYNIENYTSYISFAKKLIYSKRISYEDKINAISDLFNYYLKSQNYAEAAELYNSFKEEFKNNPIMLQKAAELNYKLKDYKNARELIELYTKKNPADKKLLRILIMIYLDENNINEAINNFNNYILTEKLDIELLIKMVSAFKKINDIEKYQFFFKLLITKFNLRNIPEIFILENLNEMFNNEQYDFLSFCFFYLDDFFKSNNEYILLKIKFFKKTFNLLELEDFFKELKNTGKLAEQKIEEEYLKYLIAAGKFNELNEYYLQNDEVLYLKGFIEYLNNNYDNALIYWQKYIEKNPKNEEVNYFISEIFANKKNYAEQIKYLEIVNEINPYNYQVLEKLIELNTRFGNIKKTEYYLFNILQIDTNSIYAKNKLKSLGLFDDDTKIINSLNYITTKTEVKLKKEYFEKVKQVFLNYIKEKKYTEALLHLEKLKFIENKFIPDYYFYYGLCNLHTHQYLKAFIYFSLSLQIKEKISTLFNLAKLNYNFRNFERALEQVQRIRILTENKEWIDLDLLEVRILFEQQNFNKLNLLLLNLKKYNLPVVEQYLYLLNEIQGDKNYEEGKYRYAITFYENNIKSNINKDKTYFKIGNCYFKLDDFENARINYEKALYYTEDNFDILNNLYLAYYNLKNFQKAEECLTKLKEIKENEKLLENPIYKIRFLLNQNKIEEAEKIINQIDDNKQRTILKIFLNYIKKREIELLNYEPKNFVNVQPIDINHFINYLYYFKNRNYKSAFEALKSAYISSSCSQFYLKEIALFFKNTNQIKNGIEFLKNQLLTNPFKNKNYIEFLIGNLYYLNEQYNTAIEYYNLVLKNNKDFQPAIKNLIITLIKTDNEDEAMYYLNNYEGDKKFKHLMNYFIYDKKELKNLADREFELAK
ncbi:MAG TPA: tetratricopeptide repeat protein [bacterium]|nr:tetratricopeptide repeat protein [bacterium]HOL47074.1 tetratricopeptide repeat protein [bacterium]HPQ18974.1 tetratricopeptide repeat protein [bacterium]